MMNFPGTATKDGTFTEELKDKESRQHKQLAEEFCAEVLVHVFIYSSLQLIIFVNDE